MLLCISFLAFFFLLLSPWHGNDDGRSQYKIQISEGRASWGVLRLVVQDADLPFTSAWRVKFNISQGDEEGRFDILTDPETNEGILNVIEVKPSGDVHLPVAAGVPIARCLSCAEHMRCGMSCVPVAPSEEGRLCHDPLLPWALGPLDFVAPLTKILSILQVSFLRWC